MSIEQYWGKIRDLNRRIYGANSSAFPSGASEGEISEEERQLGFTLPAELRTSWKVHSYVIRPWDGCDFIPVKTLHLVIAACRNDANYSPAIVRGSGVANLEFGAQLVPFAHFSNEGAGVYCMDLSPGNGGNVGQIVETDFTRATANVVASSLAELLEQGVRKLEVELSRNQGGRVGSAENHGGRQPKRKLRPLAGCAFLLGTLLLPKRLGWWLLEKSAGTGRKSPPGPKASRLRAPGDRKPAAQGTIAALWYEIEDLNREHGENTEQKFSRGATEAEVSELERGLGYRLPDDLRELFLTCAGCDYPWPSNDERDYNGFYVTSIPETIRFWNDNLDDIGAMKLFPGTCAPVMGRNLIPLEYGDPCLCYDLNPGPGGVKGQIVDVDLEMDSCRVVAPSLKALLEHGLDNLKREAVAQASRTTHDS